MKGIKLKYKCPYCLVKSYSKYWNAETFKKYGTYNNEICEIQFGENNSCHICPECKKESEMFKGELICIKLADPLCNYCDDTGYIGSPLELNCKPCTDCSIWDDKVKKASAAAVKSLGVPMSKLTEIKHRLDKVCKFRGNELYDAQKELEHNAETDLDYLLSLLEEKDKALKKIYLIADEGSQIEAYAKATLNTSSNNEGEN